MLSRPGTLAHALPRAAFSTTCRRVQLESSSNTSTSARKAKKTGDISAVFASLGGASPPLPDRFGQLKTSLVKDELHASKLIESWRDVLKSLEHELKEVEKRGSEVVPIVEFPKDESQTDKGLRAWTDDKTIKQIRKRGAVVIRGVVEKNKALEWKERIREYVRQNPSVKGFPENDKQVFELYWSKSQLEARSHPNMVRAMQTFLSDLFRTNHQSELSVDSSSDYAMSRAISLSNVITYADRLRIRHPGDSKFALGPHIDGGGVERWEDPEFRGLWYNILAGGHQWRQHDPWSFGSHGQKLTAKGDMYDAPGGCSVNRPFQGWLSLSSTGPSEGTLRVMPLLKEATAYWVLRPFFKPINPEEPNADGTYSNQFLAADNWEFDATSSEFPGCVLGGSIELNAITHPHLQLSKAMVSVPHVEPGDVVFWHDHTIHAVESQHNGKGDSSVLYIPAIPLTRANLDYLVDQKSRFLQGLPPSDFPGGEGESLFQGRGTRDDLNQIGQDALRMMGFAPFVKSEGMSDLEKRLVDECNERLGLFLEGGQLTRSAQDCQYLFRQRADIAVAATGVLTGALGAHALASRLGNKTATWSLASHFAILNGAALLAISQHPTHGKRLPGLLIATGTAMFSGSIFALLLYRERMGALSNIVGPVTPLGGLLMIGGYLGLLL
ncbi:hypothetical protein OIV83_000024 [Microbotryomycetes sp. JL201]|nr:hypothetical protein OIV83_000024 [Microbotryomycetes sp. JL201]